MNISLSNISKKIILIIFDIIIITFSIVAAYSLRLEKIYFFWEVDFRVYLIYYSIIFIAFVYFNIYQILLRYFDNFSILIIIKAVFICQFFLIIINFSIYEYIFFPRSISFIAPIIIGILIILNRIVLNYLLNVTKKINYTYNSILIYGVNENTVSLLKNLRQFPSYGIVKGFIDTQGRYQKREINGVKIFKSNSFFEIINKFKISEIIVGSNSSSSKKINKIIDQVHNKNIRVRSIKETQNYIQNFMNKFLQPEISFHDIVNRPKIKVEKNILKKKIYKKNILITGGGGSIGSELCLEILNYSPSKLFILDNSEINLFEIIRKIKQKKLFSDKIVKPMLGDFADKIFLLNYFNKLHIDEIYHAAAYKHVNFGEENQYSFYNNNVIGTINLLKFVTIKKIKNFVFISSDKAVNPKSILGYTKKLGEIVVRYFYLINAKKNETNFTIVRFGNVIGSSGSVIPIFLNQIKNNKPLTVSSKLARRYFMSIAESVRLVITAAYFNRSGIKIYAIDMGEQIKIYEIAKRIIYLSGYTLKDKKNIKGDIEIKIIGLKKGEKIEEEVTLGKKLVPTRHPQIYLCEDPIHYKNINIDLDKLIKKLKSKDIDLKGLKKILKN